jgi:hypothetical protein
MPRQPVTGLKFKSSQYQRRLYKNDEKPQSQPAAYGLTVSSCLSEQLI